MKNLFVSYDIALRLKEKGFDEPCLMCFYGEGKPEQPDKLYLPACFGKHTNSTPQRKEDVSAPLYQQVTDWFRDRHKINIYHIPENNKYEFRVEGKTPQELFVCDSSDFYEAFNKAIEEALKLI